MESTKPFSDKGIKEGIRQGIFQEDITSQCVFKNTEGILTVHYQEKILFSMGAEEFYSRESNSVLTEDDRGVAEFTLDYLDDFVVLRRQISKPKTK